MPRCGWVVGLAPLVVLATACGGDGPTPPTGGQCEGGASPTLVDLQPGQMYVSPDAAAAGCVELAQASGRYMLAVVNTNTAPAASVSFRLRGVGGAAASIAATEATSTPALAPPDVRPSPASARALGQEISRRRAHRDMLRRNHELVRTLPVRDGRVVTAGMAAANVAAATVSSVVGEVSVVRIADIEDDSPLCSGLPFEEIEVRTAYSGTRAIIVEDTEAPLAGQMDAQLIAMGTEFDQVMWPILTQNFGNPLRLDSQLDANDRIVMVISPRVNDFDGVAGYVISCDFGPRATIPSSNEGEYFYAIVPTDPSADYFVPSGALTRSNWRRIMRSVLIHEVKHLTAYAERISRGAPFEENWLEEATAMVAEELFARSVYGVGWKDNVTYQQSVFCDVRPGATECPDAPAIMIAHFFLLYEYLERVETLSPLGDPPGEDGLTFYGSGWSLVRWMMDQYASTESGFLMPLTQGPLTGIPNLQARTGRLWPEMLSHWSLANALDSRTGFTPQSALLVHPSWNYRNMYNSLNNDFSNNANLFNRPYPLVPRPVTFGAFGAQTAQIAGGTAAYFELSGTAVGQQLLELRGAQGGALPGAIRLGIVRVQ